MDGISRAIGSLESSVVNLQQAVESQGRLASDSRDAIHLKLEEGTAEMGALRHEIETMKVSLQTIEPAVKNFEKARQRREGQKSLMVIMWTVIVVFATGLGYAANFAFEYLKAFRSH